MPEVGSFVAAVGEALRSVRYARSMSQRDLAAELGVAKSTLGRWEAGALDSGLLVLVQVLQQVGFDLRLDDTRTSDEREPAEVVFPADAEAAEVVACWRERVDVERVLDASGRRPPAHRHVFPIRIPHRWWTARHPQTPWVLRPVWSWSAATSHRRAVHRLGRYPSSVGLPPRGGAPMQGFPP